jgi:hypothetical protein
VNSNERDETLLQERSAARKNPWISASQVQMTAKARAAGKGTAEEIGASFFCS